MSDVKTGCFVGDMSEHREGERSNCSGSYHEIVFTWEMRGGIKVEGENPIKTVVCDGHMAQFKALGAREEEGFVYVIESDRELDKPISPEKE